MFITHSSVIAIVIPKEEIDEKAAPEDTSETEQATPRNFTRPEAKIGF